MVSHGGLSLSVWYVPIRLSSTRVWGQLAYLPSGNSKWHPVNGTGHYNILSCRFAWIGKLIEQASWPQISFTQRTPIRPSCMRSFTRPWPCRVIVRMTPERSCRWYQIENPQDVSNELTPWGFDLDCRHHGAMVLDHGSKRAHARGPDWVVKLNELFVAWCFLQLISNSANRARRGYYNASHILDGIGICAWQIR